jgi:8-oxo-dGTP pyrophosphatase MutT (NUDIX family)
VIVRQRVALAFVARGGDVLLVARDAGAPLYPGRWTTVSGPVEPPELPEAAALRALAAELPLPVTLRSAGLPLDFTDTVKKRTIAFRVHPFLFTLADPEAPLPLPEARWVAPDDLILATALGESIPELDEALARVWDPPAALPVLYRAEARALHEDRHSSSRELAGRAAMLVAACAPAERVAALRPGRARVVSAARAAARSDRDVPAELVAAAWAEERAVSAVVAGVARLATVGAVPLPAGRAAVPVDEADLLLIAAEAVLPSGAIVAPSGATAAAEAAERRQVPVIACADAWAGWADDVPPPLEPGFELVPRAHVSRVVGVAN